MKSIKIDWAVEEFCNMYGIRSNRQKQVLQLVMDGFNDKEIGEFLGLSDKTVSYHFHNVIKKTNFRDRKNVQAEIYKIALEGNR